ncbi:MAG TPA: polyhydroxyalkanoic acid system family protein [Thermoanaerobaculia bacterium]|nr:polyhydroxyalkanoic acid system family protein [Thermoanaerobaculia bacterium]
MHIAVPHHTDRESAKKRLSQRLDQLLAQYNHYLSEHETRWEGDTLHFSGSARGFKAGGTIDVTDDEVIIDGKLPLLARPFEPRIRSTIEREANAMFG